MASCGSDVHVARTPAERTVEMVIKFTKRHWALAFGQAGQRHQEPWCAEAALQAVMVTECLLHWAE